MFEVQAACFRRQTDLDHSAQKYYFYSCKLQNNSVIRVIKGVKSHFSECFYCTYCIKKVCFEVKL